jgi:hypothetical protein
MEKSQQATSEGVHWSPSDQRAVAECVNGLINDPKTGDFYGWNKPTVIEAQRLLFAPDRRRAKSSITASLVAELQLLGGKIIEEKKQSKKNLTIEEINTLSKEWQVAATEGKSSRNIKSVYYNHQMQAIHINSSKHSNSAVERAVGHMQIDQYKAAICEVFDAMTGELHAVLTNKIRGMEIVFKRDVKDGM